MLRQLLFVLALTALLFPAFAIAQPMEEEEEPVQARPNPVDSRKATGLAEGASQMKMNRPEGAPQMNMQRPEGAPQMNMQRPEGAPQMRMRPEGASQMQKEAVQKNLPQGGH